MRERPIILTASEVLGILDGSVTQLRRPAKIPWLPGVNPGFSQARPFRNGDEWRIAGSEEMTKAFRCPFGKPGDRLWVRETFVELIAVSPASGMPLKITAGERLIEPPTSWTDAAGRTRWNYDGIVVAYRANSEIEFCDGDGFRGESANKRDLPKWSPSSHMPRRASRITLEITDVQAEGPEWVWVITVRRLP